MANVPYHADVVAFGQAICEARNGETQNLKHALVCTTRQARVVAYATKPGAFLGNISCKMKHDDSKVG